MRIAAQLGVAFLLDGSVRWAGDQVRVVADLIDGTGFSRWTHVRTAHQRRVRGAERDRQHGRDRARRAVISGHAAGPAGRVRRHHRRGRVRRHLRGSALYETGSDRASERQSLALFDTAIELDPGCAAAYGARRH